MLKYIAKISMDIFPSVLATIIGAYIVNHYINAKPAADAPAAVMAPADAGKNGKPADLANLPAPGVKAKGISEKKVADKPATEKAGDQPAAEPKTSTVDVAPAEAAPRGKPSAREKAVAKSHPGRQCTRSRHPGGGGQFGAGCCRTDRNPRRQRSRARRDRAPAQVA
ncbi:hypothetical protein ACVWWO_006562 [Bradyrhizobium sp. F1.13.1]